MATNKERAEEPQKSSDNPRDAAAARIINREEQQDQLRELLENDADAVLLHGPPGSGKTTVARHIVQDLPATSHYINCWQNYNRFTVLYKALEGLGKTLQVHRQSTPKDELVARLKNADDGQYVLILDDFDRLEDDQVLYDLHRMAHIQLVLITNDEEGAFGTMGDRVRSRFMGVPRIRFDPYSVRELKEIVTEHLGDLDEVQDAVFHASGDARKAIKFAANDVPEYLEKRGPLQEAALTEINSDTLRLARIIARDGPVTPGDLYEQYEQEVDDPRSRRTIRKYAKELERIEAIEVEGERRGKRLRLHPEVDQEVIPEP